MVAEEEEKAGRKYWSEFLSDSGKLFQFTQVARQGLSILMGILLVKLAFTQEQIGVYEMWMFLGLVFTLLCLSGSMQALGTLYHKWKAEDKPSGIWTVYGVSLMGCVLLALGIWCFQDLVLPFLFKGTSVIALGPVLIFLVMHLTAGMIPYLLLVQNKHWRFFLIYLLVMFIALIPAVIYVGTHSRSLEELIRILVAGAVLEHLFLLYLLFQISPPKFTRKQFYHFLRTIIPLTGLAGMGYAAQIFDTWLVNSTYQDAGIYAIFRYGARELPGAVALASAFATAMVVLLTKGYHKNLGRIKSGTYKALWIFTPIAVVLMLSSHVLFRWIYSEVFVASAIVFNCYLLLGISRWIFPQAILVARDHYWVLTTISLIELIVNIGLSIWWVQYLGLTGVALATVVAYFFEKVLMVCYVYFKEQVPLHHYIPVRSFIVSSCVLVATFMLTFLFGNHTLI